MKDESLLEVLRGRVHGASDRGGYPSDGQPAEDQENVVPSASRIEQRCQHENYGPHDPDPGQCRPGKSSSEPSSHPPHQIREVRWPRRLSMGCGWQTPQGAWPPARARNCGTCTITTTRSSVSWPGARESTRPSTGVPGYCGDVRRHRLPGQLGMAGEGLLRSRGDCGRVRRLRRPVDRRPRRALELSACWPCRSGAGGQGWSWCPIEEGWS